MKLVRSLPALAASALFLVSCSSKPTETAKAPPSEAATPAEAPKPAEEIVTAEPATHTVIGVVHQVHPKGEHIVVKSKDGKLHKLEMDMKADVNAFKHGMQEMASGAKDVAKATAEEVKTGSLVVARYSEKEGKLVAHHIRHGVKETVKKVDVVVDRVEADGKKVVVKTKDGVEHALEVSKHATVATGDKIESVGKITGDKIKAGSKAVVHFTEEAGQKIAHAFHHEHTK